MIPVKGASVLTGLKATNRHNCVTTNSLRKVSLAKNNDYFYTFIISYIYIFIFATNLIVFAFLKSIFSIFATK
jgi:hypothetical protein